MKTKKELSINMFRISRKYLFTLVLMFALVVLVCVGYLKLQFMVIDSTNQITKLQYNYSEIKKKNDTVYNEAINSLNIADIKNTAINEYHMIEVDQAHIVEYIKPDNSDVTQYNKIPSND